MQTSNVTMQNPESNLEIHYHRITGRGESHMFLVGSILSMSAYADCPLGMGGETGPRLHVRTTDGADTWITMASYAAACLAMNELAE